MLTWVSSIYQIIENLEDYINDTLGTHYSQYIETTILHLFRRTLHLSEELVGTLLRFPTWSWVTWKGTKHLIEMQSLWVTKNKNSNLADADRSLWIQTPPWIVSRSRITHFPPTRQSEKHFLQHCRSCSCGRRAAYLSRIRPAFCSIPSSVVATINAREDSHINRSQIHRLFDYDWIVWKIHFLPVYGRTEGN